MGLFKQKPPYSCKILERYKIDIEKTNQFYKQGRITEESFGEREYCELVAESNDYRFYNYRTYSDGSGGYILRQEKASPKKVVYFGSCKRHNCVFRGYLFQVDARGTSGFGGEQFGITARNIIDGSKISFNWLSQKYIYSQGYRGHAPSQDAVNSVEVNGDKLIFKVTRYKSDSKDFDEYDRNADYELIVQYVSGKFKANAIFPPVEVIREDDEIMEEPSNSVEETPTTKAPKNNIAQSSLGRDESKHIQCDYEDNEDDCPKECSKCAISIKTDGDIALAQNLLDEAIKNYKKAVFVEPKFAEAWVNLGNAYGLKSEYNNALSAFDKAIAIDPVYGKALYGKAISLRNLGNLEEAMEIANTILRLYDADEVRALKKGLIDAGVEDTKYVLENEEFIQELDNYGYDIADDNDLLNGQEFYDAIEECGDVYRPDEFINAVMHYCRKKYAPLGENKIRGEYIITSFYGSICAALFYAKDNSVFDNVEPFNYLMENIDVEFTDRNAERMLQTKAGEEKAEYVWSIILPYVKFSQEIFNKTSKLTDELILCAMKNAYEIGLLTAFYYINGRDKKHGLGSRIEIDKALSKLAESSKDYENPPPESAMCYSMRVPDSVNIQLKCSKCGKIFTMRVFEGEEDLISNYVNLAGEFNKLGHKAEVLSLCDDCAQRYFPSASSWSKNNIAFSFIARGSDKPVYSYPSTMSYRDFEYRVALSFLKGSDTIDKLAEDTGTKLNSETYLKHIKEVLGSSVK